MYFVVTAEAEWEHNLQLGHSIRGNIPRLSFNFSEVLKKQTLLSNLAGVRIKVWIESWFKFYMRTP